MRLPPWLWRTLKSKWTKRLLIASPFLLMIAIVSFYGIANLAGKRAIEREAAAMKAEGWPVSFEEAVGETSQAKEDVFLHPAVVREVSLFPDARVGEQSFDAPGCLSVKTFLPAALLDPAIARKVLASVVAADASFSGIKEALRRPRLGWDRSALEAGGFDKQNLLLQWSRFACDRACFRLAADEPQLALEDVETSLLIRERLADGPGLASLKFAIEVDRATMEVVDTGLRHGLWTDAQVRALQDRIEVGQPFSPHPLAARGEWAHQIEQARQGKVANSSDVAWKEIGKGLAQGLRQMSFSGVFWRGRDAWLNVRPRGFDEVDWLRELRTRRERSQWLVSRSTEARARCLVSMTEATLERYHEKQGTFPPNLEALVPEFLQRVPRDASDKLSLRHTPGGSPKVFSSVLAPRCGGCIGYEGRDYLITTDEGLKLVPKSYRY